MHFSLKHKQSRHYPLFDGAGLPLSIQEAYYSIAAFVFHVRHQLLSSSCINYTLVILHPGLIHNGSVIVSKKYEAASKLLRSDNEPTLCFTPVIQHSEYLLFCCRIMWAFDDI